jgi:hypothetical protein
MRDQDEPQDEHEIQLCDRAMRPPRTVPALAVREHKLYGIEIFPGVGTPISRSTRYGATFVAAEGGLTPLILAGWVNYAPIFFKPNTECTVVGGRWCLIEYGRRRATVHGTLGAGTIRWNGDGKLALLSVRLKATGGTGSYRHYRGAADLSGVLNHHPFPPSPPRIGATLRFAEGGVTSSENPATGPPAAKP